MSLPASGSMSRRRRNRGDGKRFAMLPLQVLEHQAVRTLSHAEFRVLTLLAGKFDGKNNGHVGLTKSQAKEQKVCNRTLYRALSTLEERGLIERTYHSSRTPPRPTMFALAWKPIDDTTYSRSTRLPSHAYREWVPKPEPATCQSEPKRKRKLSVVRP